MQRVSDIIDRLRPVLINSGLALHNADWNWQNVNSPFTRIYYVEQGNAAVYMQGCRFTLQPDRLYMIPAFATHSYECDSIFNHYYFHIYFDNSDAETLADSFDFPFEVEAGDYDHALARRLCELHHGFELPHSNPKSYDNDTTLRSNLDRSRKLPLSKNVESRGIILQLLARFIEKATPRQSCSDSRIRDALTFIRDHFSEEFDMKTLANSVHLSPDHLTRIFKRELGESPVCYVTRRKILRACQLLLTESTTVKDIAYALGFNDHSYFNRVFKKQTGMTPLEYRKANL